MSTSVVVMGVMGRMGGAIARLAKDDPDITLAGVVERPQCQALLDTFVCTAGTDLNAVLEQTPGAVVIDFTAPEGTLETAAIAARFGNPVVSGTTGLSSSQRDRLEDLARDIPLLWAPNMSIGVNVLLQVLPQLVRMLGDRYDLEMVELHHNQKKDAPSGTALKLAQCLADARGWSLEETATCCREGLIGARPAKEIGIQTIRGGDVTGVHTVYFLGPGERIEVTHQAHSRETFAQGALRAAKWLSKQNPGKLYSMSDVVL